jgi:hypothetical protein
MDHRAFFPHAKGWLMAERFLHLGDRVVNLRFADGTVFGPDVVAVPDQDIQFNGFTISLHALLEARWIPIHRATREGAEWLLEVQVPGDRVGSRRPRVHFLSLNLTEGRILWRATGGYDLDTLRSG